MFSKFINSIILLSSLANGLRVSSTSHSLANPPQPKSSSHPLAFLEKRGRSATRRQSSSSVDSESSSPPEAPVLKNIDDGVNNGQKRKRVRSDTKRLKHNKDERDRNARKKEVLKGDPAALAIAKEKDRVRNSIAYQKLGPAAKAATKLKRDNRKPEKKEYEKQRRRSVNFVPRTKDNARIIKARYEAKRVLDFTKQFDDKEEAMAAWEVEKKRLNRIKYVTRKKKALEKKALADAELLMGLRGKENEIEGGKATIESTDEVDEKFTTEEEGIVETEEEDEIIVYEV
jgi:hypothetical protein